MRRMDRKQATERYEKTRRPGVWAMRCGAQVWVGAGPDLAAARNRVEFALGQGQAPYHALAQAMAAHGPAAFSFEELESLEKVEEIALPRVLKEKRAEAAARLGGIEI